MEKKKKGLYRMIVACTFGVVALAGVGFATLSQQLTVNNNENVVAGGTWDIHFSNLSQPTTIGDAQVTQAPTFLENGTSFSGLKVKLMKPEDSVSYTFDIKNGGTLDAVLQNVQLFNGLTITGTEGTTKTADETLVGSNLIHTLEYVDSTQISVGDTLNKQAAKTVKLTVKFDSNATSVPANDVTVNLGNTTLTYEQSN